LKSNRKTIIRPFFHGQLFPEQFFPDQSAQGRIVQGKIVWGELIHEELTLIHADDLQLYTDLVGDVDNLVVRLVNDDLEKICRWSVDNSLVLNVYKTKVMLISRRDLSVVGEHLLNVAEDVAVY
jgi:hypothetical protein